MSGQDDSERARLRAALDAASALHAPVMLAQVRAALEAGRGGFYVDATFGAGGYARALLDDGADRVLGLDRDAEAVARGEGWAALYGGRLVLAQARFGVLDAAAEPYGAAQGVAMDLGVSSMQLDDAERGFSFMRDGPLDMRMGANGRSAEDLVNQAPEGELADILFRYGEERASRRIARTIVAERAGSPIRRTAQLVELIERCLPRPKPGQPHPATRSFQALRIAVNEELAELEAGLAAAERALGPGGALAVVSFHSLEDRIVKNFLRDRCGMASRGSRYQPELNQSEASFELIGRGASTPDEAEIAANPRARSAKLRAARRTGAPAREARRLARKGRR